MSVIAKPLLDVRKLTVHYPVRKGLFRRVAGAARRSN